MPPTPPPGAPHTPSRPTDPKAIRALAHPIRLDLLEYLGRSNPATAAECGRALGVSQANCSFHLRQLAKYGFVEDAGPGTDKRERRWRAVARQISVAGPGTDSPAGRHLKRVAVQREADLLLAYVDAAQAEPDTWRAAFGSRGTTVALTAAEAADLKARWRELVAPFEERMLTGDFELSDGQRVVRYFMAATPLPTTPDHQGAENGDAED